jgi:hypothetical protein
VKVYWSAPVGKNKNPQKIRFLPAEKSYQTKEYYFSVKLAYSYFNSKIVLLIKIGQSKAIYK